LIIGENEGWFELIRVSSNIDLVEVILSRKFDAVGHVFTLQMTIEPYQIVVCSYTGVHFIQMKSDDKTLTMQLFLCDLSYETEQFVNRVIEYDNDKFLAVSWDNNKFIFIDHKQENIVNILTHTMPEKFNIRCWGMAKVADFDIVKCPFVMTRDNTGFVLVNVKTIKAYQLALSPISANLFGHGDILRIAKGEAGKMRLITVIQINDTERA